MLRQNLYPDGALVMLRLTLPQNSQLINAITSRKLHEPNKASKQTGHDALAGNVGEILA